MQKHIIRKQILELRLPSPAQAFSIQELAGRIYREKVVHVIESCCNDTKSGDTVYRFDTLSIDIGSIPVNNLETEFPRKVEETLRRLLSERFNRSESNDTAERTVLQDSFAVSKKKSMIELFEYFIDYGTLPWWADGMTVDELDDILLQLTEEAPDEIIAIVHRIIHDKEKMNRLIYQFSDKVLPGVAGILLGHNPAPVLGFLEEFSFVLFQANVLEVHSENDLRLIFWREVFGHFTDAANSVPDVYRLFDNLTTSIAHQLGVEHSLLVDSVRDAVVYYQQHGHGFRSQLNTIISDMVDIPQSTSRSENTTLLPDFPVSEGDDSTGIKVDREMAPTLLREKLQAQLRSVEEAISSEGTGGRSRPESQTDLTGTSAAQRPENTAIQPHQHDQFTHNETPDPKPDKVKESRIISLDDENRTISDIPVSDSNDGTGVKSGQKITPFSQREKLQAQLRSVEEALSPEGTGGRSQPESPTDLPDLSAAPGLKNTVIQPRHKELDSPSKQPDSKPDKVKESRIISLDDENLTISDIPVSDSNDGTGVKSGQKITPTSQREKLQAQLRSVEEALSPEGTGGRSQPESRDDQPGRSKPPGEYNPGDIREADNLTESEGIPGYKSTGEIGSTTIIGNGTSSVNSPVSDGSDNSVSVQNTDETVIIQDREDVLPQKKRPPVRAANKNSIRPEEPTSTAERENTLGPDDFQEQTVSGSLRKNHDIEDSNYDANLKKGRTQNGKFFERTVIPPEKLLELAVCFLEELADRWHILQPASFSTSEWQELDIRHLTVDEGIRLFEKNAVQENPDINDFLAENVRELIKQMISRYSPHNKEELPSAPDSGSVDFDKTTTTSAGESLSIPNAGPEALAALIGMVIHGEGPDPVNPDFHTGEKPQLDIATMASGCASLPEREETESGSPPSPKAVRQLKESLKAFLAEYLRVEEADLQSSPVSATAVTEEQSSTGSCAPLFSPDEILEIVVESLINILWQQNEVIPDRESRTSTQKTGSEPVTGSDNNLYSETASRYQTEGKPILTPEQITRLRALLKVSIDNTADSSEEVQASEASTNFVSSTDVGALPVNIHQEMTEIIADIENVLSSSQLSPAAVAGLLPVIHSISERISVQEIKNRWKEMEELLQTIVKSEQSPHVFQPGKTADIIPEYRFENTDSVYFNNAGLVILWPLLEHFFAVLGLVKEGRFIDIIASERAVHILQYLVNEATETSEHELTLNKILCGLRQTDPVPRKIVLTKEDIEEADNLLRAVISNWPALGTISVDGFRAAFLQRQGMLTRRNGDWLVQVERQTHDILMDKLDWVISVIKLPWLDCLISVEW